MGNMKHLIVIVLFAGALLAGNIDFTLTREMDIAVPGEQLPVMIIFETSLDLDYINTATSSMEYWDKREFVVSLLKCNAISSQLEVLAILESSPKELVSEIKPFWIVNGIYCEITVDVIKSVCNLPGVSYLEYGRSPEEGIALIEPVNIRPVEKTDTMDGYAWGVSKVNAPSAWSQGYLGEGIIVSIVDTGVNYNHIDLSSHMWSDSEAGYYNGWDFYDDDGDPMDSYGHGTHCAGSVAGDGSAGVIAGVAPYATIMALRINYYSGGESTWLEAYEFSIDHGARVISTSLGTSHGSMAGTFRQAEENILAAGVCHAVAAGNSGPGAQTIGCPGDCPPPWLHPDQGVTGGLSAVTTVGATDSGDTVASFSSRGYSTWSSDYPWYDYPDSGGGLIDPDICAPGVNIMSCDWSDTDGYTTMDGTSMATPHVAGLMALILNVDPSLSPATVEYVLEMTALELGASGKDNAYGSGRIDAYQAVMHALSWTKTTESQAGEIVSPAILLAPVAPNPVTSSARFVLNTSSASPVSIEVYDISGRKTAIIYSGELEAGIHSFQWTPPTEIANGMYFVQASSIDGTTTERFTLIR